MGSLGAEQIQLEQREQELRIMVALAEEKRSWFVAFRTWVETVASFLDEKFPPLEALEEEHLSLLQERSDMITKRRRRDDEDDLDYNEDEEEEIEEIVRLFLDALGVLP